MYLNTMDGVIIVQKNKEECKVTSYSAIMKMALSHTISILLLWSILINANNQCMY